MQETDRASRFLSLVLRHRPDRIGLTLDREGWADIGELALKARAHGVPLTHELIAEIAATSDKQRFAIDATGRRIRANQGHSIAVDLGLEAVEPPPMLYHGTANRSLPAIRRTGLNPGRRRHVHLSVDEETAVKVGRRHGKPVVLRIDSARMWQSGRTFVRSANGVWLTDTVPVEFLDFPE